MKKLKFLGLAAIAAGMVLLTSCLDGGGNKQQLQLPSIIDYSSTSMRTLVYPLGYYTLYMPTVANDPTYSSGDVVYADFIVDFDSPDNANASANGFYVASGAASTPIEKGYLSFSELDSTALDSELLMTNLETMILLSPNYRKIIAAPQFESVMTEQKNDYRLTFDYDQEPETVDGTERVYTLYLRSQKMTDGKAPTISNAYDQRVFDAGQFYSVTKNKESVAGKNIVSYQIKYPKTFNSDSTKVATWGASNIARFSIAEESK